MQLFFIRELPAGAAPLDIIFGVIEIGCLLGIGVYFGLYGTEALIDMLSKGINLVIKKTLETRKSDEEWEDERVTPQDKSRTEH